MLIYMAVFTSRLFPFQIDLRDLRICGKPRNTSETNGFQWFSVVWSGFEWIRIGKWY